MTNRILRSFSNTTTVNTTSPGYVSLDLALENYDGHTNSSSVSCGNVSLNSSSIDVGWDGAGNGMIRTAHNLELGFSILVNSSVIAVGTSDGSRIFNDKILVFDVATGSNVSINSTSIFAGNSTQYTTINTTVVAAKSAVTLPSNVGNLPTPTDGMRAFVTDSTLAYNGTNLGANVVGTGSYHVPVYYDSSFSTWRVG